MSIKKQVPYYYPDQNDRHDNLLIHKLYKDVAKVVYPMLKEVIFENNWAANDNIILPNNVKRVSEAQWEEYYHRHVYENPIYAVKWARNKMLKESDKFVLPDWPHKSEEERQAWLDYRQKLRNITDQDLSNVVITAYQVVSGVDWPTPPMKYQ